MITPKLQQAVETVLTKGAQALEVGEQVEVSLVFADDEYIRELNLEYRGKDMSTDVLSFALDEGDEPKVVGGPEEVLLGDIIISLETASRQAEEFGHSLERELAYLTVHGLLHLLGYDHGSEPEKLRMREQEERVLSLAGISREAAQV